jgi:hypothetical protein
MDFTYRRRQRFIKMENPPQVRTAGCRNPWEYARMPAPLLDALLGLFLWLLFRLLGFRWSLREVAVCGALVGLFNWWYWTPPSGEPFAKGPVSAFVDSCARHAEVRTCQCARDRLEADLGRSEFVRLAVRIGASATVPQELGDALTRCEPSSR